MRLLDDSNNPFKLLGLPFEYSIDLKLLDKNYRQLMQLYHPDNYVSHPVVMRKSAMQMTTSINDSIALLKSPLKRAIMWMELAGLKKDAESSSSLDGAFLMAQMEWREKIEAANAKTLETYIHQINVKVSEFERSFEEMSSNVERLAEEGWPLIERWQFFIKLEKIAELKGESL